MVGDLKVLVLTRYARNGASSRVRFFQFFPYLGERGITVDSRPLFDEAYIDLLQKGKRSVLSIAVAYLRRGLFLLRSREKYDIVWLEKEVFPWIPYCIERFFIRLSKKWIIDFDDAVFHLYDNHKSYLVRKLLSRKHMLLSNDASHVVAGSTYLKQYFERISSTPVEYVPSVVDTRRFNLGLYCKRDGEKVIIGWIGQASTSCNLRAINSVLSRLVAENLVEVRLVGVGNVDLGFPFVSQNWTEEFESTLIANFDIGIMPLKDDLFERGKCAYKLIQYMAASLPVVASPVGANREVVQHGVNGYLAQGESEWYDALSILVRSQDLRQKFGIQGRKIAEERYSTLVAERRLLQIFTHPKHFPCDSIIKY